MTILAQLPALAAAAVLVVSAAALLGWVTGVEALRSVLPGLPTLKINAAIGLACLAIALLIADRWADRRWSRRLGGALAGTALLLGGLTLAEYAAGADFGIDDVVLPGLDRDPHPGRMSPLTAFGLMCLAAPLLGRFLGRRGPLAIAAAGLAMGLGSITILGVVLEAEQPTPLLNTTPMAINTGLGFIALGIGLLALDREAGALGRLARPGGGGVVLRQVLPAVIVVLPMAAILRLAGERAGLYDTAFGLTVMTVVTIAVLVFALWSTAARIDAAEQARETTARRLIHAQQTARIGGVEWDLATNEVVWSDEIYRIHGLRPGDPVPPADAFVGLIHADDRERAAEGLAGAARGETVDLDYRVSRVGGGERWLHATGRSHHVSGRTLFEATIQDVTDRKLAELATEEALRELERSNRELQEFASVASHDLQEPLRKIRAFGDRLADRAGPTLDEEARDYLGRMESAATRMQGLIDDLLTFSRVASRPEDAVPVDLGVIAGGVVEDLETRLADTKATVDIGALPTIDAAPMQMRQMLQNLIANALKFHRPGVPPRITIQAMAQDSRRWRLTVADNGIGFEPRHADRIFAPFQRLHGRAEYEGTGMGLAICRRIVERHGGTISAVGEPGVGATFTVILPERQARKEPRGG